MSFVDRREAGRRLARVLEHYRGHHPVIAALPRGGVVVGDEIARRLEASLDIIPVRKLGTPGHRELAMGAIAEGVIVLNEEVIDGARIPIDKIRDVQQAETEELERVTRRFRGSRRGIPLRGRTVIVVDDGLATGMTARAAVRAARAQGAARIVFAAPVGAPRTVRDLTAEVDEVVCLEQPAELWAIGQWYDDFSQVTDEEVLEILAARNVRVERSVRIPADGVVLDGDLTVPPGARAVVVFAHGSGSSRSSSRNRAVASDLHEAGLATLLFDLLTDGEAVDRSNVFDIELLASRLESAVTWTASEPSIAGLPIELFGASTGAAAALVAAAELGERIAAVVSRGGRPDLAGASLAVVTVPTLLIVGGCDEVVLDLNRAAQQRLRCANALEIVPGATHLFEEPGALERVSELAATWFVHALDRTGVSAS